MSPVCVLVGPPGAGKTTVGALVANALDAEFRDVDEVIAAGAGKPISEIFIDDGEDHFRALEVAAIASSLTEFDGVIALGAGAILNASTRERLRGHPVVYLTVELGEAITRIGLNSGRPLLAMNPRATLRHLLDQRTPLYEEVAVHTVGTEGREPESVAASVVEALKA